MNVHFRPSRIFQRKSEGHPVEPLTQPNLAFKYQTRMEVAISDSPSIPLSFFSMPSIFLSSICVFPFLSVCLLLLCLRSFSFLSVSFLFCLSFPPVSLLLCLSLALLSMPSLLCLFVPFCLSIYFLYLYCLPLPSSLYSCLSTFLCLSLFTQSSNIITHSSTYTQKQI